LQRQRKALQQVQYGQGVRPDLGSLLIHPEYSQIPQILEEIVPYTTDFDEAKALALNTALYSPDITLVQGPPGTGKTTWIAELVFQYLNRNPGKKVLIASQTHKALDNALEKIERLLPTSTLIRIGAAKDVAIAMDRHRLDQRVLSWGKEVNFHARENLKVWAEAHGISDLFLALSVQLEALAETQEKQVQTQRHARDLAAIIETETETTVGSETVAALEQAAERYIEMFEYVQGQLDSRLRAAEMEELRFWFEKSVTSLKTLVSKANTGPAPSAETMLSQAYAVFQRTDEMEKSLSVAGLLDSSSPLQPGVGEFIEIGVTLASEMESASSSLSIEENRIEYARCLKEAKFQGDAIRIIKKEIAVLSELPDLAEAEINTIEGEVARLLETASSDDVNQYRRLRTMQQDWLLRFGAGEGFEGALLSQADVVAGTCVGFASVDRMVDLSFDLVIIDEASKATPTEALIAMSRGKQWVLVGDEKQLPPFVDSILEQAGHLEKYELTRQDLERTLFDRLLELLPSECQTRLTIQHRMVPAIGNLISECFYNSDLRSARDDDPKSLLRRMRLKPVTWKSTSMLPHHRETRDPQSRSYLNLEEARQIEKWLGDLERCARGEGVAIKVGVISGYKEQVAHLERKVSPSDHLRWEKLSIEINSVDAFQGREVDLLIYSICRSNERGDIGFLSSSARLNVALSRGRDGLVIFGDDIHCRAKTKFDNPFLLVLNYIESHPDDCLMETVE
jgi:hypothetical protein